MQQPRALHAPLPKAWPGSRPLPRRERPRPDRQRHGALRAWANPSASIVGRTTDEPRPDLVSFFGRKSVARVGRWHRAFLEIFHEEGRPIAYVLLGIERPRPPIDLRRVAGVARLGQNLRGPPPD